MRVGLLWFDDSEDKSLEEKVSEAVAAYCSKPRFRAETPDTCYVHPSTLPAGQEVRINGVRVIAAETVAPHYFLVGVEGQGSVGGRSKKRRRSGHWKS